jgi:flavin reductase
MEQSRGSSVISETPVTPDVFKNSMRLLAGGVCIVATNNNGEWRGLTMTAVCPLTLDPPSLILCVNVDAGTNRVISTTRRVSVNLLSDDQLELAEVFSSAKVKGTERFDKKRWIDMASGVPALIGALAVLDCEVIQETVIGRHSVFFCRVQTVRLQPDKRPLIHFNRRFCAVQPVH